MVVLDIFTYLFESLMQSGRRMYNEGVHIIAYSFACKEGVQIILLCFKSASGALKKSIVLQREFNRLIVLRKRTEQSSCCVDLRS